MKTELDVALAEISEARAALNARYRRIEAKLDDLEQRLCCEIRIRVTPDEHRRLTAIALKRRQPLSALGRAALAKLSVNGAGR